MFRKASMCLIVLPLIMAVGAAESGKRRQECSCTPTGESTKWGHQANMVIDSRSYPIGTLKGVVNNVFLEPMPDALVELYPYEKDDPLPGSKGPQRPTSRTRLAACMTGADGTFQFDAPSGLYEICASKDGFSPTSVLVVLDTRKGKRRSIEVPLWVGI